MKNIVIWLSEILFVAGCLILAIGLTFEQIFLNHGSTTLGTFFHWLQTTPVYVRVIVYALVIIGAGLPIRMYKKYRALAMIRTSERRYRQLFNTMTNGYALHQIICNDAGEPVDYRFLEVNSAFEKMTGLRGADIVGKTLSEVLPNAEREWVALYGEVAIAGASKRFRRFSSQLGKWYEVMAFSPEKGQFATIVSDITVQRQHEDELEQARLAAEDTTKARTRFLANISHELRTPINAIMGFTEFLASTAMTDEQRDYVYTIKESGAILLSLVNDVLDMSKLELAQIELESIPFNLTYLVEGVTKLMRPKLHGSTVDLVYRIADDLPRVYSGDPTRIRQIIINLLSNAIKFTNRGEIVLSITRDAADAQRHATQVVPLRISVRDTGIGIPKEKQRAIFESFTQADAATTRVYGGTGLGLSIVRSLTDKMGGTVSLVSDVGIGSDFIVVLPLESIEGAGPAAEIEPLSACELRDKTVAIADDNRQAMAMLKKYCEDEGMRVVCTVESIGQVDSWLRNAQTQPDLVLIDCMVKRDADLLFVRALSQDVGTRAKFVAITSDIMPGTVARYQDLGFNAYLPKPVVRDELIKVIRTTLGANANSGVVVTRHMAEELLLSKVRVLVVDDNQINARLVKLMLEKLGCCVDCSFSGEEAVARARAVSYDLICMDLQMPGMDGIAATEQIRAEFAEVPIVAITAGETDDALDRARKAGINEIISKPVDITKIKDVLKKWVHV